MIKRYARCLVVAALLAPWLALPGSAEPKLTIEHEHLLVGRIWCPPIGNFVKLRKVMNEAARTDLLLLGERHGQPEHQLMQAAFVHAMVKAGRRPAIIFEMMPEDRQHALDRFLSSPPAGAAGLGAAVGWDERKWPPWSFYQPIAEVALERGLPIRAGDLPDAMLGRLREKGISALDETLRDLVDLDSSASKEIAGALRRQLRALHHMFVPEPVIERLVAVQIARNVVLADHLVKALQLERVDAAVLITGTEHARKDRGAAIYLPRLAPGRRVLTIAFVEVKEDELFPEDYADRFDGSLPFDFVWFMRPANVGPRAW